MDYNVNLYIAQEDFFYERVAMAMPQDSPWINHFNKEIKSVFQAGLIGKWKQVNFKMSILKFDSF